MYCDDVCIEYILFKALDKLIILSAVGMYSEIHII